MAEKKKNPYEMDEAALFERYNGPGFWIPEKRPGGKPERGGADDRDFWRRKNDPTFYDKKTMPAETESAVPDAVTEGTPLAETPAASPITAQPVSGIGLTADGRPGYAGTYDDDLLALYDRISNRPEFEYDVTKDPLYQQYKDQYMQGGKLAMRDTMGQAAALTGGYGTSYGQQVGQQAYDAYLQKLGEVVPELYGQAYGRYQDEGDKLLQQYAMLGQQRDTEYGRFRDELGDWERERSYQDQRESELYNRQYAEQQQAYAQLYALIGSTGYNPTDEELAAAGMTRAAADALKNEYTRQITPAATSGGGSSGGGGGGRSGYSSGIAQLQQYLNSLGESLDVDGLIGPLTRAAAARHGLNADDYLNGFTATGGGGSAGYTLGELLATQSGSDSNGNPTAYDAEQILDMLASQGVPITDAVIEDVLWARGK